MRFAWLRRHRRIGVHHQPLLSLSSTPARFLYWFPGYLICRASPPLRGRPLAFAIVCRLSPRPHPHCSFIPGISPGSGHRPYFRPPGLTGPGRPDKSGLAAPGIGPPGLAPHSGIRAHAIGGFRRSGAQAAAHTGHRAHRAWPGLGRACHVFVYNGFRHRLRASGITVTGHFTTASPTPPGIAGPAVRQSGGRAPRRHQAFDSPATSSL